MSVLVCIPTRDGNPHIKTVTAINRAVAVFQDASVIVVENRHNVCASRNEGVVKLLNTDADHLLFVDDDTTIPPDTIPLLLECDSPVATGCVPTIIDGRAVLAISERKKDLQWRDRWFGGIQDIELCGAACLLIRRELFENMAFPWFTYPQFREKGKFSFFSDDVAFCRRVASEGHGPIKAHGDVRCDHTKVVHCASLISSTPYRAPVSVSPGE
jgi:GT2 family glycosyltransferase